MSIRGMRNFTEAIVQRTTWPRKQRRQKRRPRKLPRRWQRRRQNGRSSRICNEKLRRRVETRSQDKPLQGSERGTIRSDLCADGGGCIKVRFFVSVLQDQMSSCAKDRCRQAATRLRRGSREPGPQNAGAPASAMTRPKDALRQLSHTSSRGRTVFLVSATRNKL